MTKAPHHVALSAGWCVWPWVQLRATGFPVRRILDLAAPDVAELADRVRVIEAEHAALRDRARAELRELPPSKPINKAIDVLGRGTVPAVTDLDSVAPALVPLRDCDARLVAARETLAQHFHDATDHTYGVLREVAQDPRFREALTWQNRNAMTTGVDVLLGEPRTGPRNKSRVVKEHLIASYVQRYHLKNDTIGFFGPICWGSLSDGTTTARPGSTLLRSRHVYFEDWAIETVAETLSADARVRPYLTPRLLPTVALTGTTLRYGFGDVRELPVPVARVLAACDGETSAVDIARRLMTEPELEIESPDEVYELLEQMVAKKLVTWALEPRALHRPERELRRLVDRLPDATAREHCLAQLDRVEAARDAVAHAAGDAVALATALERFVATFQEVTGHAGSRKGGETYAARTPLYEDCVRDLEFQLGRGVLDRFAPVFTLIGQSARWFTSTLAARYRTAFEERYRALASDGPVSYARFLSELEPLMPSGRKSEIISALGRELAQRWEAALGVDLSQQRVELSAAQLRDAIAAHFPASSPGWPSARFVSPDLLIAARSIDDINAGNYTVVLGEVHPVNTAMVRLMGLHGPAPADVMGAAYQADVETPCVTGLLPREPMLRTNIISWAPHDFDLETGPGRSWRPRSNVLRIADLVVEELGSSIGVRDTTTGLTFDIIAFFETTISGLVIGDLKLGPRAPHVPRITIDGVVICREQWHLSAAELPASRDDDRGPAQFTATRAWAAAHAMPRWVFVKIPEEPKPFYVDFASPLYVERFNKLLRKASGASISEMLPGPNETWVPDADGNTYTGELRIIGVDPTHWRAP